MFVLTISIIVLKRLLNSGLFVYYRNQRSADSSVNMKISAREEGILCIRISSGFYH